MRDSHPDIYRDVLDFHEKMGCHIALAPQHYSKRDPKALELCEKLLDEEVAEFKLAMRYGTPSAAANEAVDVVYVSVGNLIRLGLPFDRVWDAVHAANMRKSPQLNGPDPTKPKILKPVGWVPPDDDIAHAVHGWRTPINQHRPVRGEWWGGAFALGFLVGAAAVIAFIFASHLG